MVTRLVPRLVDLLFFFSFSTLCSLFLTIVISNIFFDRFVSECSVC